MSYFGELQAVDFAVGSYLASVFSTGISAHGPSEFQEFLARPTNKKIYRHRADDTTTFLRDFVNHEANRAETVGTNETEVRNFVPLPLVNYFRRPGISVSTDYIQNLIDPVKTYDDELETCFEFQVVPVVLTYAVRLIATDSLTLDSLTTAYLKTVVCIKQGKHRFDVPYKLGSVDVTQRGFVKNPKMTIFDDATPQGMGRICALETNMECEIPLVIGGTVEIADPVEIVGRIGRLIP